MIIMICVCNVVVGARANHNFGKFFVLCHTESKENSNI